MYPVAVMFIDLLGLVVYKPKLKTVYKTYKYFRQYYLSSQINYVIHCMHSISLKKVTCVNLNVPRC